MKSVQQIRAQFDTAMTASRDILRGAILRGESFEGNPAWTAMTAVAAALSWVLGRDEFGLAGLIDQLRNVDTRKSLDEG